MDLHAILNKAIEEIEEDTQISNKQNMDVV